MFRACQFSARKREKEPHAAPALPHSFGRKYLDDPADEMGLALRKKQVIIIVILSTRIFYF